MTAETKKIKDVILTFHSKSREHAQPGKGPMEQIRIQSMLDFMKLDKIPYWRRKLDDSWTDIQDPILVDEKTMLP